MTKPIHVDGKALVKEATQLLARKLQGESRRRFLRQGLTLGGVVLLTGCDISSHPDVEATLGRLSRLNDRVQQWLFDPQDLAPVYSQAQVDPNFPFNAFYGEEDIPHVDGHDYRLQVGGQVRDKKPWRLTELQRLPQVEQITRHICVEGWSAIGKWGGVPFSLFLQHVGADLSAKYIKFTCADDYFTSIDMATALHPQTQLTLSWNGGPLPPKYGYPMKLRIPTKLGYKNPKHIQIIEVTNRFPGGYWEDQGYNWFGGS
ncbi:molybdopterin-dependent oxidoreductase [Pantoea sp. 1.19]|uniref:molybdopterin-dependent oxidoreductase n=1 Tax=Pantoea sp. 1.19 TaxID=1925589 RepID=UPI000948F611|nr:molybdopterin-dependent oxidoreductase [Pantoea sp. 1.19]